MIAKIIQWAGTTGSAFLIVTGILRVFQNPKWTFAWEGLVVFGIGLVGLGIFEQLRGWEE